MNHQEVQNKRGVLCPAGLARGSAPGGSVLTALEELGGSVRSSSALGGRVVPCKNQIICPQDIGKELLPLWSFCAAKWV